MPEPILSIQFEHTTLVVLDGHTLNPGDLDWQPLRDLGSRTIHDRTAEPDIVARSRGAQVLLTSKTPLSAATIAALPELRALGALATGFNVVDTAAARALGVQCLPADHDSGDLNRT
jgi:glycerate dehydrogenase